MPRSMKDSDEDVELKTGRRTRVLTTQSMVDSPIRRSSRIKQSAKVQKFSPDSGSDTSISSNQPVRTTRQRTATMDSISIETLKERHVRKPSVSSETSEIIDIDVETPSKRTTRRSITTVTPLNTPTRVSTRISNKRFIRAGSETKSPPPISRTTRRTRSSSVGPETMSDQSKNIPNVPIKLRRRASVLPSQSPVKEEIEEKQSDVKIDVTLEEVEEITSSDKVACSEEKQKVKEIDNINKDKVEEDNSNDEMILTVALDETSEQLVDNKIHSKYTAAIIDKNSSDKIQGSCTDLSSNDEIVNDDPNATKNTKRDKSEVIENEECLTEIEHSLIDTHTKSPTKELVVRLENILETSIGEQNRSPSNKENQTLNIIDDTSAEKSIGPIITNITSLNIKSLTTVFANKSLNEKEIKFTKNESSLSKRRRSRESTETAVKHIAILKENTDNIEETMDSSTDSLNPIIIHEKKHLDHSSMDDTTKRQSLAHDVDKKSTTTNDTVEPASLLVNDGKLVEEIIDDHMSDENDTEMANKLDKSVTNTETCNKTIDSEKSSGFLIANDNEMIVQLEESNVPQDKNKSLNESMKIAVEPNFDHSNESIDVETCDNTSMAVDKLVSITQDEAKDDLLDSAEQTKKDLSNTVTKSMLESSSTTSETINSTSSDLKIDNTTIQDMQSSDVMIVSEESIVDVPLEKAESINTSQVTSIQRENEDTSTMSVGKKSTQLDQEDKENIKDQGDLGNTKIDDDKSDVDNVSTFRDIPADEWKEDAVETTKAVEDESNLVLVENESEAEYDLVLVDKQAWLAAENIKAVREKECFEYDSDDTVLLKSRLDTTQANSNKKRLSSINEALLINIDDDDEEEEEEEEREEEEEATAKPIRTRKSSIKEKSALGKDENSSTICIDVDDSNSINKFLHKSEKDLNRSISRPASRLNKSGQAAEESVKMLDESDDEIEDETDRLNKSVQARKNASLRKLTEKQESLSKSSKNTPSRRNIQNNSVNKSQVGNLEEELDNTKTHTEKILKKKRQSLNKSEKFDEDLDIDEVEPESKKSSSSEKSDKEDDDIFINVEDSDENDTQNKNLRYKKSNLKCSTLALVGSSSNNSSKSSDDTTEDSFKENENICSLFELDSDTDNDDDGSIDSDIKKIYNLDGEEQEYSDDNVPYDECRTSESESSDPDDTGSDLADFIVADDAIEGEKNEEDEREEQNEDDEQERKEDEAAEPEEIEEDMDIDDEQVEDVKEENDSIHAEEDEDEKSVRTEMNVSKNNASDKSLKIDKNERKISTKHTVACQSKKKEDIKAKKLHTKKVEKTNILDTSGSTSIKKRRKSCTNETEQNSIKQLNESETNRKKLSKAIRTSMECSTPKNNFSKEEFTNDVETAIIALEAEDEKSNSMSETTQHKKRKSRKHSILKEDFSFKESKRTNSKEKLYTSLPSDLLEKVGKTRPMSETIELSKTMNVTHTETPTIRDLRKEKLNESAPELKLRTETSQLQTKRLSKEEDNIVQEKTDELDNDEEMLDLIALFNDSTQETSQQKQKKRKKQAKEVSNENITKNVVLQDMTESNIPEQQKKKKKKEKNDELSQILTVEDTVPKDTCQLVKKKKKKKINATKTDENTREDNIQDICKEKKGTLYTVKDEVQYNKTEATESDISKQQMKKKKKKEKNDELSQILTVEGTVSKDTCQLVEKKKKKKINSTKTDENTREDNIQDICREKKGTLHTVKDEVQYNKTEAIESDISKQQMKKKKKKQKIDKLGQILTVEDTIHKDTCQLVEKKKKKKINVTKTDENAREDNVQQEDICKKEKDTLHTVKDEIQHSKKKKENIVANVEYNNIPSTENIVIGKKKIKQQEIIDSNESLSKELLKKKKKEQKEMKVGEKISSPQTGTSKLKSTSTKKTEFQKSQLQNIFLSRTVESKNADFIKARSEASEAIKSATERIKLNKKLKKKKREDNENTIQEQDIKIPIKRQKTEKHLEEQKQAVQLSLSGLKRLPDNVIEKLSDMPTRIKKRKLSQNTEQVMPSLSIKKSKFLETKAKFIPSSNGSTTQFAIVDMSKVKKQPSKTIAPVISYRQRMLDRNKREPISSYLMYLQKQRAVRKSPKDGFSDNVF